MFCLATLHNGALHVSTRYSVLAAGRVDRTLLNSNTYTYCKLQNNKTSELFCLATLHDGALHVSTRYSVLAAGRIDRTTLNSNTFTHIVSCRITRLVSHVSPGDTPRRGSPCIYSVFCARCWKD
ncbi:hypothetical protein J6590_012087 [Homalodisca vitripennis]|nr:hypothetical protein J6590_012087 [Homalodisca vitripennis]